ncbi:TetR/AcrR family transcriptional regulator [Streptomyces sp. NBC_00557]|uniref:TetR/AcrR family transcriptional regulator n=1 Tax=Streptomyces sp. NBC_00557 TaxID=2975776 RepID=UPI002E81EDEF|nr:TetR family transcriptional regulator [Streptomyces sp. NBC_00557]WUC39181.1 TetR family transcriptional regulator [Streptomyces sp. NBC_00557]
MPRPVNAEKRAELLKQVVHHLQHHGVAQMSLSPLAESIGTTKRMLLYYFGSRENLLAQALAACRPDAHAMFDDVRDVAGLRKAAETLWEAMTVGEQSGPIRMLLQLLSLAATDPEQYGDIAAETVEVMIAPIAAAYVRLGHSPEQARAGATLLVSGLRGLCQDRLVTHDVARTDAAAGRLIRDAVAAAD